MPTATVNGITINYLLEGEGEETVVLINGLADDLYAWDFQVPALLEAGYRVLRFDNRGIGASDKPEGPYTSDQMAADAKALVDSLGITGFHLMGVSMGGMISQAYAIAHPEDLKSLTLGATYGKADAFDQAMFAMWADLAKAIDVRFVMRDVMLWAFTGPFFTDHPDEAAEFADAMAQLDMPLEAYLAQLNVIQQHDTLDRIGAISERVPTFVLAGEEDILIPVRLSKQLHEAATGSSFGTVPGGHACMWEFPDAFNTAYIDFLKTVR